MKIIAILDFQQVIINGGKDVIARHVLYADRLSERTNHKFALKILTTGELSHVAPEHRELFLRISGTGPSFVRNIIALRRFISNNRNIYLIVSGDVFTSGLQALLSQILSGRKIPIQYQVHADLAARGWASHSLKNRLKFLIAYVVIKNANNIRTVSNRQSENIKRIARRKALIQVVPVPLNTPTTLNSNKEFHDPFTIGILGRVQKDRGISLIDCFAKEFERENVKLKFIFAGNGPDDSTIQDICAKFPSSIEFENLGFLASDELHKFWNKSDCLLNLAPFESYGRSMREAMMLGIRVISVPNSGSLDLLDEVGPDWLFLWTPSANVTAPALVRKVKSLDKGTPHPFFSGAGSQNIEKLIQSWIDCH